MDLLNTITNIDGVWVDTIVFFSILAIMVLGTLLCVDDLTMQSGISRARRNKLLGYSTFKCIAEMPILFVIVGIVNLILGVLSVCVFDKSVNTALSLVVSFILLFAIGLMFGTMLVCIVVTPISKIIYYCRLIVGKPNTLTGYYAYRMMQVYPTTLTTKHFDLGIYHFDKEQFNKRLADGEKLAESMNKSSSLEDKMKCIDDAIDYRMYH